MNTIDIRDLALNVYETIRNIRRWHGAPLTITDGQETLAVMIRHEVYAPRLETYEMRQDGDITCRHCPGLIITNPNPYNLGTAAKAANQHHADTHNRGTT